MTSGYDAGQRRALQQALAAGETLSCPVCDVPLSTQAVDPRAELPYVRRRLWVLCPQCRRTASIDTPHRKF